MWFPMTMRRQKAVWVMASHPRWKRKRFLSRIWIRRTLWKAKSATHLWMWVLKNACLTGELPEETRGVGGGQFEESSKFSGRIAASVKQGSHSQLLDPLERTGWEINRGGRGQCVCVCVSVVVVGGGSVWALRSDPPAYSGNFRTVGCSFHVLWSAPLLLWKPI